MNTEIKLPSLAERAMLVNLKIGTWAGYAYDAVATMDGFGSKDLGRANKALLKHSSQFKKTKAAFNAVRQYVNQNTVPWKDDGVRLLPSSNYFGFTQGLGDVKREAEAELAELVRVFDGEVLNDKVRFDTEAAKSGKVSLFDPMDYPDSIADKFYVSVGFEPIPQASDFRVDVSEADKEALNKAVIRAQEAVTTHILEEITKPMQALAAHLTKPVEDVKRFHESIVTNVEDVVCRMEKLNVNDDGRVKELIEHVREELSPYVKAPEILKESQAARDDARNKLNEMLGKFGLVGV